MPRTKNANKTKIVPHTEGDWREQADASVNAVGGKKETCVCVCGDPDRPATSEDHANARLIARGPRLLRMVERFIEALINGPENLSYEKSEQMLEQASVLIAPVVKPAEAAHDAQRPPEDSP